MATALQQPANLLGIATCRSNLARFLRSLGKLEEAEQQLREALDLSIRAYDSTEDPRLSVYLGGLGAVLLDQERYQEAYPRLKQALDWDRDRFGAENPVLARSLGNLARCLFGLRQFKEAFSLVQQGLRILHQSGRTESGDAAQLYELLAGMCKRSGQIDDADHHYRTALAIQRELGMHRPNYHTVLLNYGILCLEQGQAAKARDLHLEGIRVSELVYGPDHVRVTEQQLCLLMALVELEDWPGLREPVQAFLRFTELDQPKKTNSDKAVTAVLFLLHGLDTKSKKGARYLKEVCRLIGEAYGQSALSHALATWEDPKRDLP